MIYGLYRTVFGGNPAGRSQRIRCYLGTLLLGGIFLASQPADATQRVALSWDPSPDASVTGYRVYRGVGIPPVFDTIDVRDALTCEVPDLREGETYQFFVTAYDASGLESDPSNTLIFVVPMPPLSSTVTRDAQGRPAMRIKALAVTGKRVALETSTDLVNWVGLNTSAVGVAIDMTVLVSSNQPQRFFRSKLVP